jgi:hypothetical protein
MDHTPAVLKAVVISKTYSNAGPNDEARPDAIRQNGAVAGAGRRTARGKKIEGLCPSSTPAGSTCMSTSFLHLRSIIDVKNFQRSRKIVDIYVDPVGRAGEVKALAC